MTEKKSTIIRKIPNAWPKMNAVLRISWRISDSLECLVSGQIFRRVFAKLLVGMIGLIYSLAVVIGAATAQPGSIYTVGGVKVDMTAETAAAAREQAIVGGHILAFKRLVARLVPERQQGTLPALAQSAIVPMVVSFEIESEKRSSVRYLGSLKFRFQRSRVRQFLKTNGVEFAETRSKPVLLLPVYDSAGAKLLWDDPNPWLLAWQAVPPSDGLVPIRLPAGDLADIRDISAEQAVAGNAAQLAIVAERYGVGSVLVAEASVTVAAGTWARALTVATRYFGGTSDGRTAVRSFAFSQDETAASIVGRAAQQVAVEVEEDWKEENLIRFENQNSLVARLRLTGLRQWVEVRRKLEGISFLRRWQLVAMTRRNVSVRLNYYGDPEQLRIALAQRDLILEQGAVDWLLRDSREVSGSEREELGPIIPSPVKTPQPTEDQQTRDRMEGYITR